MSRWSTHGSLSAEYEGTRILNVMSCCRILLLKCNSKCYCLNLKMRAWVWIACACPTGSRQQNNYFFSQSLMGNLNQDTEIHVRLQKRTQTFKGWFSCRSCCTGCDGSASTYPNAGVSQGEATKEGGVWSNLQHTSSVFLGFFPETLTHVCGAY